MAGGEGEAPKREHGPEAGFSRRLERWSRPVAVGLILLAMAVLGLALGRAWLRDARRHVVVEAEVTEDLEQVFVNCQFVGDVDPDETEAESFDLGWLQPDDRISLAVVNLNQPDANVYFRGFSNDEQAFFYKKGSLAAPGISVRSRRRYIFERTATADGDLIGGAGCQRSRFVVHGIGEYLRLADEVGSARLFRASDQRLNPRRFEADRSMDLLDEAGHAGPWILAALGIALMVPLAIRELFWVDEWDWRDAVPLGIGVIGTLLSLVGVVPWRMAFVAVGLVLYLLVIMVLWGVPKRLGVSSAAESAGSGSR